MGEILVFLHYSICFSLLRVFAYLIHSVRDVNYMLFALFFSLGSVSFLGFFLFCSNEVAFAAPKT